MHIATAIQHGSSLNHAPTLEMEGGSRQTAAIEPVSPIIELERVTFGYGRSEAVVRDVSLRVQAGEVCVILGRSGAGKSTLLRLISGGLLPDIGSVSVCGRMLTRQSRSAIQRRIGMIHQDHDLVPRLTVLDNVLAGLLPWTPHWRAIIKWFSLAQRRAACGVLAEVGLESEHLYRKAASLSGGQRQRVAIARACVRKPAVLLADEPVASLDPHISRQVLKSLRGYARRHEHTLVCSMHQVELALEFADRLVAIRRGEVVADAAPAAFDQGVLSQVYGDGEADTAPERGGPIVASFSQDHAEQPRQAHAMQVIQA